jgi:two-component system NtrC family sensor kinase
MGALTSSATSEILRLISVLDTLIQSAAMLCGADIGTIRRRDGARYAVAATYGYKPGWREQLDRYPSSVGRSSMFGRTALEAPTVHISPMYSLMSSDVSTPSFQDSKGTRVAF